MRGRRQSSRERHRWHHVGVCAHRRPSHLRLDICRRHAIDFSGAAIPSIRLHLRRHGRASRHRRTPADGAGQPHIVRRRRRYSSIRRPRARRARRIKFRFALLVT